jgi:hypothetical protein
MEQQRDLTEITAITDELYTWFICLQNSGFNELTAHALLHPLILTGVIRRES